MVQDEPSVQLTFELAPTLTVQVAPFRQLTLELSLATTSHTVSSHSTLLLRPISRLHSAAFMQLKLHDDVHVASQLAPELQLRLSLPVESSTQDAPASQTQAAPAQGQPSPGHITVGEPEQPMAISATKEKSQGIVRMQSTPFADQKRIGT